MPQRLLVPCTYPGCPELVPTGRCIEHQRQAEQQRGSSRQRGYRSTGHAAFRREVLTRDPICVVCHRAPSRHADHHPRSRRQLEQAGLDANDPQYGRGLCHPCHSKQTTQHQPGGWHAG